MQQNRPTPQENSTPGTIAGEAVKVATTSFIIATFMHPVDVALQNLHTTDSKGNFGKTLHTGALAALAKPFAKGLMSSIKGSTLKNTSLSQRGGVHEFLGGKQELSLKQEAPLGESEVSGQLELEAKTGSKLSSNIATSIAIGGMDTTITQHHSNQKTLNLHKFNMLQRGQDFVIPRPRTYSESYKVFRAGYDMRLIRNTLFVAGLFWTPQLANTFNTFFPGHKPINTFTASLVSGLGIGFIGNACDVIGKNRVIRINPNNFQSPSTLSVVRELGIKAMTRGYKTSGLYTGMIYYALPWAEEIATKVEKRTRAMSCSFFNNAATTNSISSENNYDSTAQLSRFWSS